MDRGAWWAKVRGVTKSWTWVNAWAHTTGKVDQSLGFEKFWKTVNNTFLLDSYHFFSHQWLCELGLRWVEWLCAWIPQETAETRWSSGPKFWRQEWVSWPALATGGPKWPPLLCSCGSNKGSFQLHRLPSTPHQPCPGFRGWGWDRTDSWLQNRRGQN